MDRERFDALARLFAATSSRRAALAVLLGAGLVGAVTDGEARKQKRSRHGASANRPQHKGGGRVSAQATCGNPGPSSNLNGCNFNNEDLSGANLSSSAMRGTTFRGANLCGADLSSSKLKNADFRGFNSPGNPTNLTRADLSSSGCNGTLFNARTIFCQTKTCNGSISNRDCPAGVDPEDICCDTADCDAGRLCCGGVCRECCTDDDCPNCTECNGDGQCAPCDGCCAADGSCQPGDQTDACGDGGGACQDCPAPDGGSAECQTGGVCAAVCPPAAPLICPTLPGRCQVCCGFNTGCTNAFGCRCILTAAGVVDCSNVNTCSCVTTCTDCPAATHVCGPAGSATICGSNFPCCERCRAT